MSPRLEESRCLHERVVTSLSAMSSRPTAFYKIVLTNRGAFFELIHQSRAHNKNTKAVSRDGSSCSAHTARTRKHNVKFSIFVVVCTRSVGELEHTSCMPHATGQVDAGTPSSNVFLLIVVSTLVLTRMGRLLSLDMLYNSTILVPLANTVAVHLFLFCCKKKPTAENGVCKKRGVTLPCEV